MHLHKLSPATIIACLALFVVLGALLFFSAQALAAAPVIASESVSNITEQGELTEEDATVDAQVNPGGLETKYEIWLSYRDCQNAPAGAYECESISEERVGHGQIAAGDEAETVSAEVSHLLPGYAYSYWVVAKNSEAKAEGHHETFRALAPPPVISDESASNVSEHDARLEAHINPNGRYTGYDFVIYTIPSSDGDYNWTQNCSFDIPGYDGCAEYVKMPPPGVRESRAEYIAAGSGEQTVSVDVASIGVTLEPGSTYHFKVVASNSDNYEGLVTGTEESFATPPYHAPVVDSTSVSNITPTDATLEAQIDTEGQATSYEFLLSYDPCPECEDRETARIDLPNGLLLPSFQDQSVSLDLARIGVTLHDSGEYEYSLRAINASGKTEARTQTFRAAPPPMVEPLSTATSPMSGTGEPNASDSGGRPTAGSGGALSSSTPGAALVPSLRQATKLKVLKSIGKNLAAGLRACKKGPKKRRAGCEKYARDRYVPATTMKSVKSKHGLAAEKKNR